MKRPRKKGRAIPGLQQRREFALLLAARIHRAGEPARPGYHSDTFSLHGASGKVFSLENIYKEFSLASRREREEVLKKCTRSWFRLDQGLPATYSDAQFDLLPTMRRRTSHEVDLLEQECGGYPALPGLVHAGDFAVQAAFDWPECIAGVTGNQLLTWEKSLEEVLETALCNLRSRSQEGLDRAAPGYWVSPWKDDYDSARILLPEVIHQCEVRGSHVAMISRRDSLIVTGSEDTEGLERMAAAAEAAFDGPRFLSAIPLVFEGDRSRPFAPSENNQLFRRYQSLWHLSMASDYSRQGSLLTSLYRQGGVDLYSAQLQPILRSGWVTGTTWTEGIISLLPRAQVIFFVSVGEDEEAVTIHAACSWERVREVVDDLIEPLGMYPERYRVVSFPSAEQLEAMKSDGHDLRNTLLLR